MTELKPCSFCGKHNLRQSNDEDGHYVFCYSTGCTAYGIGFLFDQWQSRPLEDALRKKLENALYEINAMIVYVGSRDGIYTWDIKYQLMEVLKKLESE